MSSLRRPIKSLGQNFLVDRNIIAKIISSADIQSGEAVLEIGPGRGALTGQLAERAGRLVLIEFDHALAAWHRDQFKDNERVSVIDGDVLKVDLAEILSHDPGKWTVVANLPYNISTEVLFRLNKVHDRLSQMTLMLQKEVGDRLSSPPDCSAYGVTTVLLGLWFDIRMEFVVPPESFHPPPKIDSAILTFTALESARTDVGDEDIFRDVVKSAFSMRRKTLANCLKSAECTKNVDIAQLLKMCDIDGRRRGETLSLEEFARLSRRLNERTVNDY